MSGLFGKSKSKSNSQQQSQSTSQNQSASWNDAYDLIKNAQSGVQDRGVKANSFLSRLLGLEGDEAADAGFKQYRDSSGYNFMMDEGRRQVEGSAAGKRMLQSGSTLKALQDRGQQTGSLFFNKYLEQLLSLVQQGSQAGGLIGSAGQRSVGMGQAQSTSSGTSSSTSTSKPGFGGFAGSLLGSVSALRKE